MENREEAAAYVNIGPEVDSCSKQHNQIECQHKHFLLGLKFFMNFVGKQGEAYL